MQLIFDRGTLVLRAVPSELDVGALPGVCWDERVQLWRAPGRVAYSLMAALKRRGVHVTDGVRPKLAPPSAFRTISLRDYQSAALHAWRSAGRRGVLALPTGAGKTHIALAVMAATAAPALCLVPTRALLGQWMTAIREVYGGPVGCLGDGEHHLQPVTVATFASAHRHMQSVGDKFGLLVVDEAHHFGNSRFDEALQMSIAPLRLGLTATPPQDVEAMDALARLVGPVVFEVAVADLLGTSLAPFERITLRLWLDPDEQTALDDLSQIYRQAFATFQATHPRGEWKDFVAMAGHTDEGRRALAAWRRTRRLLAFPRCKQRALASLLAQARDRRTLVFVGDNETAYAVAREHLIMPLTCDIGRTEREDVLQRFRDGRLRALVSAQVLNEGLDVPDADVGIVVAGRCGTREHTQRVGRLLRPRPGKHARVYELVVQRSNEVRQANLRWSRLVTRSRSAA
ncbi:MAG: DEAD/DEAH box helicase family protein [Deltaproteobacteria bacterium]|nr:DEAD/DEAH box helicase family protein [Deltaproteobacteria bacterium]